MKSFLKNAIFCAGALPLLCKFPYLVQTFRTSPIEKSGAYFWLAIPILALVSWLIFAFVKKTKHSGESSENLSPHFFCHWNVLLKWLFFISLVILILVWGALNFVYSVNAAGVVLGIVIFACAFMWRFGWTAFYSQIPVFAIAVIASPSVLFWLNHYSGLRLERFFEIKLALSLAIFGVWNLFFLFSKKYPKPSTALFVGLACLALLFISAKKDWSASGDALDIADSSSFVAASKSNLEVWQFRQLELSESDLRFFSTSKKVERYVFASASGGQLGLLSIKVGKASDIHPIGICLKTSGAEVKNSEQIFIKTSSKNLQANRLEVVSGGQLFVMYSWFSNGEISTGDFLKFRFLSGGGGEWSHYQVMMPYEGNYDANIEDFKSFLENFSK